jgi:hypothetical protein
MLRAAPKIIFVIARGRAGEPFDVGVHTYVPRRDARHGEISDRLKPQAHICYSAP